MPEDEEGEGTLNGEAPELVFEQASDPFDFINEEARMNLLAESESFPSKYDLRNVDTDGDGEVDRVAGENRYATSAAIAKRFFEEPTNVALAYGLNFPDGLCGGPLAYRNNAPLLLVNNPDSSRKAAAAIDDPSYRSFAAQPRRSRRYNA